MFFFTNDMCKYILIDCETVMSLGSVLDISCLMDKSLWSLWGCSSLCGLFLEDSSNSIFRGQQQQHPGQRTAAAASLTGILAS